MILIIIDIHMHIGNLLQPNGGATIYNKTPYPCLGLLSLDDLLSYRQSHFTQWISSHCGARITVEEQRRNAAGTLLNCSAMLDQTAQWDRRHGGDGRVTACVQPVAPHVTHADLRAASSHELRLQPWASPDFTRPLPDMIADLLAQEQDAPGMKIHPIIQCVAFDQEALRAAMEVWRKPVLFHTGSASYYPPNQSHRQRPENSDPIAAERLIADFPHVPVILGHAGLFEAAQWEPLAKYDNVFVDGSFQGPLQLRRLVQVYGEMRVMYASDWPYGKPQTALHAAALAFKGELLQRFLWRNAAALGIRKDEVL